MKIFIVEDDPVIASAVAEHIASWGCETRIAQNFQNIVQEFVDFDPQLVLLDVGLPFYNGYHWCSEIRRFSSVPIIFVSSASDNMNIVMAINMGADDFIAKPFDLNVLLSLIHILRAGNFLIHGAAAHQLVVRADADGLAAVEHDYLVRVAYRADALRDDYFCRSAELPVQLRAERRVGLVVERGERVVKDQNFRLPRQRAGDREPLLLAAGDVAPELGDAVLLACLLYTSRPR